MRLEERAKFKDLMMDMAAPFGKAKDIDRSMLSAWYNSLKDFKLDEISVVFQELVKTSTFFPKPVEAIQKLESRVRNTNFKTKTMTRRQMLELAHEWPVIDKIYSSSLQIFWEIYVQKKGDLLDRFRRLFYSMRQLRSMPDEKFKAWCSDMDDLMEDFEKQSPELDMAEMYRQAEFAFCILNPEGRLYNKMNSEKRKFISTKQMLADEFRAVQAMVKDRWDYLDELKGWTR
jgi:hypothetical protein